MKPLVLIAFFAALVCVAVWLLLARGPRRWRAYRRALFFVQKRSWRQALEAGRRLGTLGAPTRRWKERLRKVRGESERLAGEVALEERRFEEALEHCQAAAPFLGLNVAEVRAPVVNSMLTEVRRQFAYPAESESPHALLTRTLQLQPECQEALFWQGLLAVRESRTGDALASLHAAGTAQERPRISDLYDGSGQPASPPPIAPAPVDPPLYYGTLLLREGRVPEALRQLSDANRVYGGCPFVHWQLGTALVAAGNDSLGVRALHKALGAAGLPRWISAPQNAWIEGFPDGSFVRRLAARHLFRCPVFGQDVAAMVRQAKLTLAQAYTRLNRHADAVALYEAMLRDSPPTVPVLRGLGLALARQEQYDQAFPHLRAAFEMENPKNHLTAGYLALCAANAKPSRPEDKASNLSWSVQLLGRFSIQRDAEWASLCSRVLAAARTHGIRAPVENQVRLCDALASVEATTPEAAQAYEDLAVSGAAGLRPQHAWLYCRAAQEHNCATGRGLELFARTLQDPAARRFFADRQWSFDDVEYSYLRQLAAGNGQAPGSAGRALGPAQQALFLRRSRQHEAAGQLEEARKSAEALLRLAPKNCQALDRLAYLAYRQEQLDEAVKHLDAWQQLDPREPLPCLRRAIIEQRRGDREACLAALAATVARVGDERRSEIGLLCARVALALCPAERRQAGEPAWDKAHAYLQQSLEHDPRNTKALGFLATMYAVSGRRERLAELAPSFRQMNVAEPVYRYLSALCHLAAGRLGEAVEAALAAQAQAKQRQDLALARECSLVIGWALSLLGKNAPAAAELAIVADASTPSPSADHARNLLARMAFAGGDLTRAAFWWSAVSEARRKDWGLEHTLRQTLLLAGILAFRDANYEDATRLLRESRDLDRTDSQLDRLIELAHLQAAMRLLQAKHATPLELEAAAEHLTQVLHDGVRNPVVAYVLALTYKRSKDWPNARRALQQITAPDIHVLLQSGIVELRANTTGTLSSVQEAAKEWERALKAAGASAPSPVRFAVAFNLLRAQLSLGHIESALAVIPQVSASALREEDRVFLNQLHALLFGPTASGAQVAAVAGMSSHVEEMLLNLARTLGNLDVADRLLSSLAAARPRSPSVTQAVREITLLRGLKALERCDAAPGTELLAPLAKRHDVPPPLRLALLNVLGCCCYLAQDFSRAAKAFAAALELDARDARLHQNLALVCEMQARIKRRDDRYADLAKLEWDRYLELLSERIPAPPGQPAYWEELKFECLGRLAQRSTDSRQPAAAVEYLEQAQALRPDDADTVEKLFHVYNELQRFSEAKEMLLRLHSLREVAAGVEIIESDEA